MENNSELVFSKKLFGGKIDIIFWDIGFGHASKIVKIAYKESLRLQKIFNFYDPKSEISILNKKRKLNVSNEFLELLNKALFLCKETNGQYDISLGKVILSRKTGKKEHLSGSYRDISINKNQIILKNPDISIDLGSIAKGYITDLLALFISSKGINDFMIDSRGDMVFSGKRVHILPIQHPRSKKDFCSIKVSGEAVATSGDYNQFKGDYSNSHLINSKEIISCTVVAPTLEIADAYATALIVSKPKDRESLLKKNKQIKVLLIDNKLHSNMYNKFKEIIL